LGETTDYVVYEGICVSFFFLTAADQMPTYKSLKLDNMLLGLDALKVSSKPKMRGISKRRHGNNWSVEKSTISLVLLPVQIYTLVLAKMVVAPGPLNPLGRLVSLQATTREETKSKSLDGFKSNGKPAQMSVVARIAEAVPSLPAVSSPLKAVFTLGPTDFLFFSKTTTAQDFCTGNGVGAGDTGRHLEGKKVGKGLSCLTFKFT